MDPNHHATQPPQPRARERYAHLYMPLITAFLFFINGPIVTRLTNDDPRDTVWLTAASALPTYFVASQLYPADRPDATPEEAVRFTRKNDAYRALVLATYGRLFGTPFNYQFLIGDFILSYVMGMAIGERPVGTRQRRSEFLVALLWVAGSWVAGSLVPPSMPTLSFLVGTFDRTIWRAAYLALVDDIVGLLSRPDVRSLRGKVTVIVAQSFTITSLIFLAIAWLQRLRAGPYPYEKTA